MKKILLFLTLFTGMTLTGCNDSFLEKYPVTSLTEENAFQSYDNFKAFMWPCYEMFSNTNIATSTTAIDVILTISVTYMPDIWNKEVQAAKINMRFRQ